MRRVLVTGGARRIGAAISQGLAADGWDVVIHCNTSRADANSLAARMIRSGGVCSVVQADLSDREAVAGLIGRVGDLDALINNASSFRYDSLATMDAASWDAHFGPNLAAPVFLAQAFAAARAGRPGCVINMLDHKVTALNPDFFSYTIAKVAMAGATRLLAQALRDVGIRVNGVAPGITLLSGKQTEAGFARAWRAPPLGRSSTPAELVAACRFVLATGSLNGQVIVLDGGESLLGRQRDIAFET